MSTRNLSARVLTVSALALVLLTSPIAAQQSEQALRIRAANLTVASATPAALGARGVNPQAFRAGDVIEYTLEFTNIRPEPVENVVLTDPIPAGLTYIAGTAAAATTRFEVEFSIDEGETWAAAPQVVERVDGVERSRDARPDEFTNIRWTLLGAVAPGDRVSASFQARLAATRAVR